VTASTPSAPAGAGPAASVPLLSGDLLRRLNERRDGPGWRRLAFHSAVLVVGALLWGAPLAALPTPALGALRLAGLLLLGWGLAFGFCAMHECGHRTAFARKGLNDTVAWWAGVLSFYNADFYRRYHQWHHRYTHQPGLDPELEEPPPGSLGTYLLELSGLPWWLGKLRSHADGLRGDFGGKPYMPAEATEAVTRSIRLQWAVYGVLLLASLWDGNGALLRFWLLPLAVGQPLLRFVLMAEHGGCSTSTDGRRNTRTTLTLAPLRWLMWDMPFHVEHHLYPSLPFHALAEAHTHLAPHMEHCDPGYLAVHRGFLGDPARLALP
jgi:fatty acid desaturase